MLSTNCKVPVVKSCHRGLENAARCHIPTLSCRITCSFSAVVNFAHKRVCLHKFAIELDYVD